MKKISQVSFLLLLVLGSWSVYATHIRALEITARRISVTNLTFEFTITGYRDTEGVLFDQGDFDFGDGTIAEEINWTFVENVGNDTEKWRFTLTHTFAGPGAYKVSYREPFRNDGINNIANSVGTYYYTETLILIDPLIGVNSTPILTVPPIDLAGSGLIFIHNPGAFDEDGDSLSYVMSIPQQDRDFEVGGYQSLISPVFYDVYGEGNSANDGPPTLMLDPATGDLVWDAAAMEGEYNVSFIVEEWRKINGVYFRLGFVTRDMQIIVEATDNEPPELDIPDELCVAAGTLIDDTVYEPDIIGTDPDGDPVTIEAFGGPFEIPQPASFSPDPPTPQGPPGILSFEWDTDCSHIRNRPYEVRLKIEDNPSLNPDRTGPAPKLVDFETWEITIVGPAPTGLISTGLPGRRMQLNWDSYSCPNTGSMMQIWRRVGEFDFASEDCEIGIPENSGYEMIASLPIDSDVYIDNNNGLGLASGANYCYRLVAIFPEPKGGMSYASEEACSEVEAIVPLITEVDIISTDKTNGQIQVEWIDPLDIDMGMFPGPYTYDVLRATGQQSTGSFISIATNLNDKFFDDSGLNTEDDSYSYKILLYDNTGTPVDTSFAASSVRLELVPQVEAIKVTWDALVPWSNNDPDFPIHEVYRDNINSGNPNELVLIGLVDVTQSGFIFLDDGAHNGIDLDEEVTYCYYVKVQGSYNNADPTIPDPLVNNSQIQCARPNDEEDPCTPLSLAFDPLVSCETLLSAGTDCDFDFLNKLMWELDMESECDDDVVSFNLYFSETGAEGSYTLLTNTTGTDFTHLGLNSFNGCYKVSSVDRSSNESVLSEPACNENCIFDSAGNLGYVLPNAFSPNGDGFNDTFRAFGDNDPDLCPRFVLSVDFQVIDRTGKRLFTFSSNEDENDIYINWDGKTDGGIDLPAGTYYYSAIVIFDTLDASQAKHTLNGWIQILK